jgi:hypothetical protein
MGNTYEDDMDEMEGGNSNRAMLSNSNSKQNGGMELNTGFVEYITTISSNEKAQMLNMLQYGGLAILPLLIILKFMKMYVPEEDPLKGTPELVLEILLQLGFILIAFFFIHKLICYLPTYSKVEYGNMNLLCLIMPVFFLMFAMDTNVGAKLNVVFDRLLVTLGIKKENFEGSSNEGKEVNQAGASSSIITSQHSYSQGMNDAPMADRLIGGHQTQRDPVVQQQQPSMIMPNLVEPMAANDTGFGSPF